MGLCSNQLLNSSLFLSLHFRTLDYIFIDKRLRSSQARVIPKVAEPSMTGLPLTNDANASTSTMDQWIRRSQPSMTWPSDHFMLFAEIELLS